jgi:hypothetical protein
MISTAASGLGDRGIRKIGKSQRDYLAGAQAEHDPIHR